ATTAPATASPSPGASGAGGTEIRSGVDTSITPAPLQTGDTFVTQPTPSPTPLGAVGPKVAASGARGLAIPDGKQWPYFLRQTSLLELDSEGRPGQTYGSPITQAVACVADGARSIWVLSDGPAHVDRFLLGISGLQGTTAFSPGGTPRALGARGGEVWAAVAGGTLARYRLSDNATASFAGFGSPRALWVGQTHVWVGGAKQVFKVKRADGASEATYAASADPIALAEAADGSGWALLDGASQALRIAGDGATASINLGAAASAIAADARRVWVALPGKVAHFKPDGTKEGELPVAYQDPIEGSQSLTGSAMARDGLGRIWVLDASAGVAVPVWGRKEGE
ncbi:MAG: hypothetical protein FJZ01_13550, partial [Candidatus Sericytochromatia bacterium]|nr:hypothetical protein [Candidatus Tanganyikabacteria bacterium]